MEDTLKKIQFFSDRAFQQALILSDFIEGHCSKAEALMWQTEAINKDLKEIKRLIATLTDNNE